MKTMILVLGLLPSVVAAAGVGVGVGDRATRQVTVRQDGQQQQVYKIELAITRLNVEEGTALLTSTENGVVSEKWLTPAAQHNAAQFEELLANCGDIGGTREDISVPAGHFPTCRFRHSDGKQENTLWVGQVPFGTVKSETRWRPTGRIEIQELEAFSHQ